jgi:hypothetical protein
MVMKGNELWRTVITCDENFPVARALFRFPGEKEVESGMRQSTAVEGGQMASNKAAMGGANQFLKAVEGGG